MLRQWVRLEGATILDNGCGLGTYLEALGRFSQRRFGLEVEHDRAVQAVHCAEGIVEAVGERLPFPDGSFDLVLSNEVIEHVQDDGLAAREMVRVTKARGRIAFTSPCSTN